MKGTWQFPGGHLEMGESLIACAERETLEETGLKVKGLKVVAVTNDVFDAQTKHYVTVFVLCQRENENEQPQVSLLFVYPGISLGMINGYALQAKY